MARPVKIGLDYFPLDVNFDDNLEAFIDNVGAAGMLFMLRLWQAAYKTTNGEVDCSTIIRRTTLAKRANISLETLEQFINIAGELQLIDLNRYKSDLILTSNGIKKRINKVNQERRKAIERKGYQLLDDCSANNERTRGESKAKQSKVNINNNNQSTSTDPNEISFVVVNGSDDVESLLLKAGFAPQAAKDLSSHATADVVRKVITYANSKPQIKNKLGYIRKAIIGDWVGTQSEAITLRPERKLFKSNNLSIQPKINELVNECAKKLEKVI